MKWKLLLLWEISSGISNSLLVLSSWYPFITKERSNMKISKLTLQKQLKCSNVVIRRWRCHCARIMYIKKKQSWTNSKSFAFSFNLARWRELEIQVASQSNNLINMPWISSKDSPDLTATDAMPLTLALWGCGIPFHLFTPLVSWWHFEWRTWQQILLSFTSSRKEIFQFFPDLSGNNKWFYPFSSPPQCSWCRIWKSTSSRNKLSCLWVKMEKFTFSVLLTHCHR